MKTFDNFVQELNLNNKLIEAATLMAEKDVDSKEFLTTWYENNHPELAVLFNEAGFWKNVWNGVKQGAQEFSANRAFDTAIKSLTDLAGYMQNNPKLSALQTTGQFIGQLNNISKQLGQLKTKAIDINARAQNQQPQSQQSPPPQPPPQQPQAKVDPMSQGTANWAQQQAQKQRMGFPAMG